MIQRTGITYVSKINHLLARVIDPNTGEPPTVATTDNITIVVTYKTTETIISTTMPSVASVLHDEPQFDPDRWHEADGYNVEHQYVATTTGTHEVAITLQPDTGDAYSVVWTLQVLPEQS